jgi:hypothetical protein
MVNYIKLLSLLLLETEHEATNSLPSSAKELYLYLPYIFMGQFLKFNLMF